jgi:hypothetical protein
VTGGEPGAGFDDVDGGPEPPPPGGGVVVVVVVVPLGLTVTVALISVGCTVQ